MNNDNDDKINLLRMIGNSPQTCRHSMRHAWKHLEKAENLLGIDNEMSVFRAITAEEEASTGLIKILRHHKYNNASKLNPKKHSHKAGIWSLFSIFGYFIETEIEKVFEVIKIIGIETDQLKIVMKTAFTKKPDQWIEVTPPLGMSIFENGAIASFKNYQDHFATEKHKKSILAFIDDEANLRNKLLYSSPEGMPNVEENPILFVKERLKRVKTISYIYLLIAQHKEKQLFVQQALDIYVDLLEIKK
mgnify:CR=1 FL=1|tara:strand:+ start:77 stop:817 length:741 start_codon:yes stop_codon:yes gene_type:complete